MPRLRNTTKLVLLLTTLALLPARAEKNLPRPLGTTRYAPMLAQLRGLLAYDQAAGAHRMALVSLGHSVRGRDLWMVTLQGHPAVQDIPPAPLAAGADGVLAIPAPPKRVFYLCRQHGHEPASTEAALQFITQLVRAAPGSPLASELDRVTVSIVPMANPDGAEAFLRHNAHDKDLNRDWLRRTQPETRALYLAIQRVHPDLMTDQHELYPDDTRPDFTETAGPGSGAPLSVIQTCGDWQAVVQAAMEAGGTGVVSHQVTDHHPARLAHRYGSIVAGVPTLLFETNRVKGGGRSVASRAQAQGQFMAAVLRYAAGERDQMLAEAAVSLNARTRALPLLASRHKPYQRPGVGMNTPPPAPSAPLPAPATPPLTGEQNSDAPAKDAD